jgi:4-alpha-glucanotransferase
MKLSFHINFHTVWGQKLYIYGSIPELGNWETALAKEMEYTGDGNWHLSIEISPTSNTVEYRYFVMTNECKIFEEWEWNHSIIPDHKENYICLDCWQARPINIACYSSAFTNSIFSHSHVQLLSKDSIIRHKLILKIFAPLVEKNQCLAITGNRDYLGNWSIEKALLLHRKPNSPEWSIDLDVEEMFLPLEYKFLVVDAYSRRLICWESEENRILPLINIESSTVQVSGLFFRDNFPLWQGVGTVIPVFSLRSQKSFGVGDLGDLQMFIDWIKMTGQRFIQILPMNDTTVTGTWRDSYPYSAISIYALHPMYICLHWLDRLEDERLYNSFEDKGKAANALEEVDYEAVVDMKLKYCRAIFLQNKDWSTKEDARKFINDNIEWLKPYSTYSLLRDTYKTADTSRWEKYAVYNETIVNELYALYPDEISFYYFLQYTLHIQFLAVANYARANGIVLKGDLPIGVNRKSVEVWTEPELFNMHGQAGAPPDDFSLTGQNWAFPTYNWDRMEKDKFAWWKHRFAKLSDYFDSFRIDHILGFFRIWEIPMEYTQGLCGHFNPALPLSKSEIEQYGLSFNESRFTTPHINTKYLAGLFGEYTDEVCNYYLAQSSSNHYILKSFCDTQAKIELLLIDKPAQIKNGLLSIANETLFIRDPYNKDKFHPRISASHSCIYNELSSSDRYAFDHLYRDFYYRRHNEYWKETAYRRLIPLIQSTRMLACGEDLGMIPETVPEVMNKLQILSLEIERSPKSPDREFTDLSQLPYLSVCTTSTHDMSPLRSWWAEENRDKIQRYYNNVLGKNGCAPLECTAEIARIIIENHLKSPSMLKIIPLQDWLAINDRLKRRNYEAERINIPANPAHYWRYRMHITIEDLIAAEDLNNDLRAMIST